MRIILTRNKDLVKMLKKTERFNFSGRFSATFYQVLVNFKLLSKAGICQLLIKKFSVCFKYQWIYEVKIIWHTCLLVIYLFTVRYYNLLQTSELLTPVNLPWGSTDCPPVFSIHTPDCLVEFSVSPLLCISRDDILKLSGSDVLMTKRFTIAIFCYEQTTMNNSGLEFTVPILNQIA